MQRLEEIIKLEDKDFYLYQFPTPLYILHGDLAHDIVNDLKDDDYMGVRTSHELINPCDITGEIVAEWGCNVGATSYNILQMSPNILRSFDISHKAIDFCRYIKDELGLDNWYPYIGDSRNTIEVCDVSIWEDPHTADYDEIEKIILNIVRCTERKIYFLECDNIKHILDDMFGDELEELRWDSWKVVL